MDLTPYVENLRRELAVAAEAGGEDARALAERLTAPLESAIRLMLLDALSAAADEITRELAPGSVELRLRAGEPEFVVTPAPADEPAEPAPDAAGARAAGRRRGRDGAHQPPAARAAQGRRRAGRRPRAAVGQRLARPRRRRRASRATTRPPPAAARRPARPGLHRLGALTAPPSASTPPDLSNLTPQEDTPCPPSTPPNRSRPRSTSPSATSGSPPATAPTRSSRCARATRPTSEDVKAAEQTRVEYADGQLLVKAPKLRSWLQPQRRRVDRRDDRAARRLARARRPAAGATSTATAGSATAGSRPASATSGSTRPTRCNLKTGAGDISVDRATGDAEVTTGSGDVRLRELDGSAVIKNSNGDTWIGAVAGDLRVNAANGNIAVDRAHAGVVAKTANGDVRLGEVVRGSVVLETRLGDLEVGIREGTAAWLDVRAAVRPGPQRARRRRRPRAVGRDRRGARPHLRRRHRDPASLTAIDRDREREHMTRPQSAIAATGLRKSYGDKVVLDGIDLDVAEGTVFALLGPNGAGKTTIVQILSTLIGADAGDAPRRRPRPGPRARRGARRDRRHRPVLGRRQPAHRRGEPAPDGRPAPPRPARGPAARRRAARAVRPGRGGRRSRPPPTPAACGAGSTWR